MQNKLLKASLRLSFSKISTYQACPLKFKFRYIDGLPTVWNMHLVLGIALHESIAEYGYYHQAIWMKKPIKEISEQELGSFMDSIYRLEFKKHLKKVPVDHPTFQERKSFFGRGVKALKTFVQREGEIIYKEDGDELDCFDDVYPPQQIVGTRVPIHVEEKFNIGIDDDGVEIRLTGIFDRIDLDFEEISGGEPIIVEFKTKLSPSAKKQYFDQVQMYIYAYGKINHKVPRKAIIQSIQDYDSIEYTTNENDLIAIEEKVKTISHEIRQGNFHPRPTKFNCTYCDFQKTCPASLFRNT